MTLTHRIELIPAWLFLVELGISLVAAPVAILVRADMAFLPAALLLVSYSLGAYDVLSLTRHQSERAPVQASALTGVAYLAVLASDSNGMVGEQLLSAAAALACVVGFVPLHHWLRRRFLSAAQTLTLSVAPELADQADVLAHHLQLSGYPGSVILSDGGEMEASARGPEADVRLAGSDDLVRFCDEALRVLPPELLELSPEYLETAAGRGYLFVKRLADVLISSIVLAVTLPLWILAVAGILITDGRKVFYSQVRVGKGGRFFGILKFRTLRPPRTNAATPMHEVEKRTYPFGTFLRRSRIDELPQLLLVLRGTMSLVGPRPEMVFFHRRSSRSIPMYRHRLAAKPGLTGWAQIRYAHSTTDAEYRDKTAYDLWYVAHRNLTVDGKIMLRTIGILLNRFGAK